MKNLRFAVISFFALITIASASWWQFVGNVQWDTAAGVPAASEGMSFYHNVAKSLGIYDDNRLQVLKDDAQKKNLMGNHVGDAEYYDSAVAPVGFTETGSGTWSIDTTAADQLEGTQTFRFSPGAVNDEACFPNINVPEAVNQSSINLGYSFRYKYSEATDDFEVRAVCVDDSSYLLDVSDDDVTLFTDRFKATGIIPVPKDCNVIKLCVEAVTYTASSTIDIDNIQVSDDPFVYKNLVIRQEYKLDQLASAMTNVNAEVEFNLATATISNTGSSILIASDDAANTRTKWTATRRCTVHLQGYGAQTAGGYAMAFGKNGSAVIVGDISGANTAGFVSGPIELDAGDYITFGAGYQNGGAAPVFSNTNLYTSLFAGVRIVATAEAEHVVHASKGDTQEYTIFQHADVMSNITGEVEYNLATATITNTGADFLTASDDAANTRTIWTASRDVVVSYSFTSAINTAGISVGIAKNGTPYQYGNNNGLNEISIVSGSVDLAAGDFISFASMSELSISGGLRSAGIDTKVTLHVHPKAKSLYVVVPTDETETMKGWTSFDPTSLLSGVGTPANTIGWYRRIGDSMEMILKFVTGTVDANNAYVTIPDSLTINTTVVTSDGEYGVGVGHGLSGASSALPNRYYYGFLKNSDSNKIYLTTSSAAGVYETRAGNGIFSSSSAYSFHFKNIPIQGWTMATGIIPQGKFSKVRTAYVYETTTSNVASVANTVHTRALSDLSGDTEFVTLDTVNDRFTLQPGKYILEYWGYSNAVDITSIFIYDFTNTAYVETDVPNEFNYSSDAQGRLIKGSLVLDITSSTTYELRHYTQTASGNGLCTGAAYSATNNPATANRCSEVKITQILAR